MIKKLIASIIAGFVAYYAMQEDPFKAEMVKNLRVVITGASSGIGEQLAYHYARMGAHIVIAARREQQLQQVIARCKELAPVGNKLFYVVADMSKPEESKKVIQFAVEKLGGIDQLVMNHAYCATMDYWRGTAHNISDLHWTMDVNFFSFVHLWSEAMPHLIRSQGAVGVVSSDSGKIPTIFMSSYSTSKFALDGFFGAIRQEMKEAKNNVTVTLHVLGLIETALSRRLLEDGFDKFMLPENAKEAKAQLMGVDPSECAYQIIRATTLGEREHYHPSDYPQLVGLMVKLRAIIPSYIEQSYIPDENGVF